MSMQIEDMVLRMCQAYETGHKIGYNAALMDIINIIIDLAEDEEGHDDQGDYSEDSTTE